MPAPKFRRFVASGFSRTGVKVTALILGILALSCSGSGGESKEAPPGGAAALVFRNFTLIDGTGGAPLAPAAMVVQNGRVSWVGSATDLKAPEGATVTDLNGAYVIPGLMDMHAHIGNTVDLVQDKSNHTRESVEKDLRTYASYGVTTVMSMGTDQDTIFPIRNDQRSAASANASAGQGRLSMARVYTAG